jgi:aminocarboxymuconate-semialdehyde decarboxylase
MLIDFHIHLDPGAQGTDAPRTRYRDGIPVYTEHNRSADVKGLLSVMDTCGIDVAVLSCGRGLRGEATEAKNANRALADVCAGHPNRLRHLAHVPPPGPGWLDEVESWLDTCPGAAVPADYGELRLDDARFEDLYSLLERRRRFLWVHPSMAPGRAEAGLYDAYDLYRTVGREFALVSATLRLVLGGVLDRHPGLVLVISHLGGGISALAPRVRHYQDKTMWGVAQDPVHGRRPRLPFDDYLKRIYFDTGGFFGDPSVVRIALEHIPGDRILLGTDYPQEIRGPEPIRGLVAEFVRQGIAGNGMQLIGGAACGAA